MNTYLWIKLLHILSATLLFGTGLGIAFFMLRSYLSGSVEAMTVTARTVVLADWLFTTPAVVVQLLTGFWLTKETGMSFGSVWFVSVITLFGFVGLCWIPVVFIQIRIRNIIANGGGPSEYRLLMHKWIALGVPAFIAVLVLFYLMVSKAGASVIIF